MAEVISLLSFDSTVDINDVVSYKESNTLNVGTGLKGDTMLYY